MKLDPNKAIYDQEFDWVAHPDCLNKGENEKFLINNRYELEIIGGIQDKDANYNYDDWALCKLGAQYYLLSTSGCSCPSPHETWRIEKGPSSLDDIRKHVVHGDYDGYTLPKKQANDFLSLLDEAKKNEK